MFQYRSDFPDFLKEHAVFVDMAPRFREMAEETMQKQLQLITCNLNEVQSLLMETHCLKFGTKSPY